MIFNASQIVDKDLFALTSVTVHQLPDVASPIIRTVPTGGRVGKVYSYIMRGNDLFWQLNDIDGGGYVLHVKNTFSIQALTDQGAIDEKTLNTPQLTLKDRLIAALGISFKTLSIALPVIIIAIAAYFILIAYKKSR